METPGSIQKPASARVLLTVPETSKPIDIRIAGVLGNSVKHFVSESPETVIDLDGITDGVYFVTVTCDGISTIKKIVINK